MAEIDAVNGTGTVINYTDKDLFANTTYYYKVRAVGVGGNSPFTAEINAQTPSSSNADPAIDPISDVILTEYSAAAINVVATDTNGDALTLSTEDFAWFCCFY